MKENTIEGLKRAIEILKDFPAYNYEGETTLMLERIIERLRIELLSISSLNKDKTND